MSHRGKLIAAWALGCTLGFVPVRTALGSAEVPAHTPPRLSLLEGEVWFWRPAVGDWERATVNLPLARGDVLEVRGQGRAELQLRPGQYLRVGSESEVQLTGQDESSFRFELGNGVLMLDIQSLEFPEQLTVSARTVQVQPLREGFYRIEVQPGVVRLVTRKGARARVTSSQGEREIGPDSEIILFEATASGLPLARPAPPLDDFDRWNLQRSAELGTGRVPLAADVVGLNDLDRFGEWRTVTTYGLVWFPRVPRIWAPYSVGRWVWDPFYGWTWVDAAPWGWVPFHYGRWVWVDGRWGWTLGPPGPRWVYAPALVVFFVGKGGFVGIATGAPVVAWAPLGWGEPCLPWWGPKWFIGKPWWGGWHGPRRPVNLRDRVTETGPPRREPENDFEHVRERRGLQSIRSDRFGLLPIVAAREQRVEIERLALGGHDLPRRPARVAAPSLSEPGSSGRDWPAGRSGRHTRPPYAARNSRDGEEGRFPRQPHVYDPASSFEGGKQPNDAAKVGRSRRAPLRPADSGAWGPFAPRIRSGESLEAEGPRSATRPGGGALSGLPGLGPPDLRRRPVHPDLPRLPSPGARSVRSTLPGPDVAPESPPSAWDRPSRAARRDDRAPWRGEDRPLRSPRVFSANPATDVDGGLPAKIGPRRPHSPHLAGPSRLPVGMESAPAGSFRGNNAGLSSDGGGGLDRPASRKREFWSRGEHRTAGRPR
ncbi:MAG: hypothetical protein KatS3mg077_2407 [Candidatus Binatia bacterium]|nr:MAG: hypothetical protein KatS3mg077_2407 [Candidatus Binatia bacterium]